MALSFSIHTTDEPGMDFIKRLLTQYNFGVVDTITQDSRYNYREETVRDRFDVHYSSINEKGERLKKSLSTPQELIYGKHDRGVFTYSITSL